MRRIRGTQFLVLFAVVGLVAAACSDDEPAPAAPTGGNDAGTVCATVDAAAGDLLADICERGEIVVSTDPAYPPQSSLNEETGEYEGFDIDVATEIATRLGVDISWQEPSWEVLTAGNWNERWDMSVGSMTPTNERQAVLDFTTPYSFVPAVVVVHEENTSIADLSADLDGTEIGFCAGCTYEQYVDKSLAITGFEFNFVIDDATAHGYDTDTTALQDLALGDGQRLDAVITSSTTAQGYIDAGNPVKIVGDPVFFEPLSIAFDKSSDLDDASLVAAVDTMVTQMHTDGTLATFSQLWFNGLDVTGAQG